MDKSAIRPLDVEDVFPRAWSGGAMFYDPRDPLIDLDKQMAKFGLFIIGMSVALIAAGIAILIWGIRHCAC